MRVTCHNVPGELREPMVDVEWEEWPIRLTTHAAHEAFHEPTSDLV